ncbi:MAG: carboxypeptidase regulatory-like domain-containing protein, partial [Candidatus Electrothrix sp. MAN1_4]|nr:carboxypeptidase regulatory-like domain-containing protein [Candidatus Electrothrix sp. MAN1_4]
MKIRLAYRILTILFISFCSYFLSTVGEVQAGSIEGSVFDDSAAPLAGLLVGVYGENDSNTLIKSAETSGTGKYTLDNLPDGAYKIVIFTSNTDYIREWYNSGSDAYSFTDAEPVPVASDPVSLDDTFLKEGAKITGRVTAEGSLTKIAGNQGVR